MLLSLLPIISSIMGRIKNLALEQSSSAKLFRERRPALENEEESFGETLQDFGYAFNEDGELRNIETNERFKYDVKSGDRAYNQRHYEALGEVITEEIYRLLETKAGLNKIKTPFDAKNGEVSGFFFASDDYETNEKMLVLIHGSGFVRAGQWTRRLIINENLNTGTQLPYIEKAKAAGFAVVVLNTNQNKMVNGKGSDSYIRDNEDPVSHALHVWDHFIEPSKAKHIAIVAHSAGGYVTVKLALERSEEFVKRVFAVAFTDSAHASPSRSSEGWKHLMRVGQNWVTSRQRLDTLLPQYRDEIFRVSAGTTSHEETSSSAIESVCDYIKSKLDQLLKKPAPSFEEQEDDDEVVIVEEKKNQQVDNNIDGGAQELQNGSDKEAERVVVNDEEMNKDGSNEKESVEQVANGIETDKKKRHNAEDFKNVEVAKKKKYNAEEGQQNIEEEPELKRGKIEL